MRVRAPVFAFLSVTNAREILTSDAVGWLRLCLLNLLGPPLDHPGAMMKYAIRRHKSKAPGADCRNPGGTDWKITDAAAKNDIVADFANRSSESYRRVTGDS